MQLNPMLAIFNLGGGEIILILAIVLILFGAKKLPELAKGLGQGIKEFKKAAHNASEGMLDAMEETSPSAPKRLSPATTVSTRSRIGLPQAGWDSSAFFLCAGEQRSAR